MKRADLLRGLAALPIVAPLASVLPKAPVFTAEIVDNAGAIVERYAYANEGLLNMEMLQRMSLLPYQWSIRFGDGHVVEQWLHDPTSPLEWAR